MPPNLSLRIQQPQRSWPSPPFLCTAHARQHCENGCSRKTREYWVYRVSRRADIEVETTASIQGDMECIKPVASPFSLVAPPRHDGGPSIPRGVDWGKGIHYKLTWLQTLDKENKCLRLSLWILLLPPAQQRKGLMSELVLAQEFHDQNTLKMFPCEDTQAAARF